MKHDGIVLPCNRRFVATPPWISQVPILKSIFVLIALTLMASIPARADPLKVAVFNFELVDTSLQGEVDGPRKDEQQRLMTPEISCARGWRNPENSPFSTCRSMLQRTAAICRPAVAAMCNTPNGSARGPRHHGSSSKGLEPHSQYECLLARYPHQQPRDIHERGFARQYRRILVPRDELFAAEPIARAELWRSAVKSSTEPYAFSRAACQRR